MTPEELDEVIKNGMQHIVCTRCHRREAGWYGKRWLCFLCAKKLGLIKETK